MVTHDRAHKFQSSDPPGSNLQPQFPSGTPPLLLGQRESQIPPTFGTKVEDAQDAAHPPCNPSCLTLCNKQDVPSHLPTLGTHEYTMWRTRVLLWCASGASAKYDTEWVNRSGDT